MNENLYNQSTNASSLDTSLVSRLLGDSDGALYQIEAYREVGSTNTLAKQASLPEPHRMRVIIADSQSAGRGRLGRSFYSPCVHGLYMSILLDKEGMRWELDTLTPRVALCVARAIESLTSFMGIGIKWVNDLYIGSKKICGILCESGACRDLSGKSYVVIGIGVNISETEFPSEISDIAGSVLSCTGEIIKREELIAAIIRELIGCEDDFMSAYAKRSVVVGRPVRVITQGVEYDAFAVGITEKGALEIRTCDGQLSELTFGEVSVRLDKNR